MFATANLALGVTLALVLSVGVRLLGAARRTRRLPELCIGLALVLSATGGAAEGAAVRLGAAGGLVSLPGAALGLHALAAAVLYVAVWRVFQPVRAWARLLALLGSAITLAGWLGSAGFVPGTDSAGGLERLVFHAGRAGAYAWGAWESLHYHVRMQRRLRLGLADAVIADQFRLWGIASSCMVAVMLLAVLAEQAVGRWIFDWTPGLMGMALFGLIAALALSGAFFPPRFYRRAVAAGLSLSSLLDRLIPQQIRDGPPDALHSARILLVAAASALAWGPAFIIFAAQRGAPEIAVVVAAHVALIALQPFVLRVTGSLAVSANLVLLSVFGLVLVAGSVGGGINSPGMPWLLVLPIGGFFLAGTRAGIGWTVVSLGAVLGFHFAARWGEPVVLPAAQQAVVPTVRALQLLAILSVITAVGWRFLREKQRAVAEMAAARDQAREANEAKMRFLAAMSHEIRTPMNGALGMTELLMASDLTEEQRRFAETIHRCGHTLLSVIDDVLDFSRIESGKLRLERHDFDPRGLLEDVLEIVAEAATAKGLELHCSVSLEVPPLLRGDPDRLRQVLINLVGNAVKFTERGEVEVTASALAPALPDGRVYVRFEVRDTGIGFSPDLGQHIFERFTQADQSMSRRYGGTGLGLAIARELARLMGGEIECESVPDEGSCFRVTLPLTPVADDADAEEDFPSELRGHRVLIVDDNATNREILSRQLAGWGLRCHSAPSGVRGLEALREAETAGSPFALALLDLHMPGMDGAELVQAIRARPSLGKTRLLVLTSIGPAGQEEELRELDVDGFLRKPVREAQLRRRIEETLRGHPLSPTRPPDPRLGLLREAPARVLLVEDNPVNQSITIRMLEMLGYEAEVAGDGLDALAVLVHGRFDLVLMDCQMPGLDGFDATRQLRAREDAGSCARVPVIALTASAMQGDRERCLDAGMDDYLAKPFSSAQLGQVLRRWLPQGVGPPGPIDAPALADVLKQSALDEIRALDKEGSPGLLGEIIDSYLDSTPHVVEELRTAIATRDPGGLHRGAHKLKSSSAILGATQLAETCLRLEQLGRSDSLEGASELLETLETQFHQACRALLAEREAAS